MAPPDDFTLRAERELRDAMDVATLRRRVAELETEIAALQRLKRAAIAAVEQCSIDAAYPDELAARREFYAAVEAAQAGGGRRGEGGEG